jgi:2,4-dienoyl-CoA reductase (NADPH2)
MNTPSIFSSLRLGTYRLKNRLVALPVYTGYAHPDGTVSAMMVRHYGRLADSGVSLVFSLAINMRDSGYFRLLGE